MGLTDNKAACRSEEVNKLHSTGGARSDAGVLVNTTAGHNSDARQFGSTYGLPIFSFVSNNIVFKYHSEVSQLLSNGGVLSFPFALGNQTAGDNSDARKSDSIGRKSVLPLALSNKTDDRSGAARSSEPGSPPISPEALPWLKDIIIKSTEVAFFSALVWPPRAASASAAMELRGGLRQSLWELIRKEGYFPKTRQHLMGSASYRHQFTNVFIQLWFNVFTHYTAEELARRHGGLSELGQLLFVAGIAALGAAPGTYSIVKKINPQHVRPQSKFLVAGLIFEWGREAGFNKGCLHANTVVDRYMPEASEVHKTVLVGVLSALCGMGTGVFHALACMCYDRPPPSNQNPSAPDSMLRFFKTSLPAFVKEKAAMESLGYRGLAVGISMAMLEIYKKIKNNFNPMTLN